MSSLFTKQVSWEPGSCSVNLIKLTHWKCSSSHSNLVVNFKDKQIMQHKQTIKDKCWTLTKVWKLIVGGSVQVFFIINV